MPVATETKDSINILTLAQESLNDLPSKSTPVKMELDDLSEKEQDPQPMDLNALVKRATESGLPSPVIAGHHSKIVIIFDWDDTLLASSFLSSKGYRLDSNVELSAEVDAGLRQLEQSIIGVITLALKYAEVHIVTNAETGWVQLSAQKWIPAVLPLLSKVMVISARSTYEERFPGSPFQWKYNAMQSTIHNIYGASLTEIDSKLAQHKHMQVISLGDSHVEREAVRAVTRNLPGVLCKSVKFAEHPSLEQLRRQLDLVTNCFQYIVDNQADLDLMLTITSFY